MSPTHTHTSPVTQPCNNFFLLIAKEFSTAREEEEWSLYFKSTGSMQIALSTLTGGNTVCEQLWELQQPSRPAWNLSQPLGKLLKSMLGFLAHAQVFGWAGTIFKCGMQNPTQWLLQWQTTKVFLIYNNAVIYGGAFSLNQNLRLICSSQAIVS